MALQTFLHSLSKNSTIGKIFQGFMRQEIQNFELLAVFLGTGLNQCQRLILEEL